MSGQDSFQRVLGEADPDVIARMVAFVAEVALVIDPDNRVRDVSTSNNLDAPLDTETWKGRLFSDLVVPESAAAAQSLLATTRADRRADSQEIVHPTPYGQVGVRYAAAASGREGDVILIGSPSRMHRRAAWSSENLFRSLWEFGADAMLVLDGSTGKIRDGNHAAAAILGESPEKLRRFRLVDMLDPGWRAEVSSRLRGVLSSGRSDRMIVVPKQADAARVILTMEPSRGEERGLVVARFLPADDDAAADGIASSLPQLIRESPDPVVLVDRGGTLVWTNDAFLAAVGAPAAPLAVGQRIDEFLKSKTDPDMSTLLETTARQGRVAVEGLWLEGLSAPAVPVDAMLVDVSAGSLPCFGLVLRVKSEATRARDTGASLDLSGLTDLVGRTPLKDLVQNTTDVVEKMCVEAALRLTGNNRSAAARALGLSRQAFYLKLNRLGLGDHTDE
ncbi:PAS domain-containing protein [Aquibium carbonis]|uniref:PAS domain-containing protein n=1 Tax=Aquibium carbonis TaxID=2495581 RepID=A0A429YTK2_9HYPH|nr:PAS domain-containing protein [Aquibium carbonis]RST84712.1 PAS domain-containing protein [Aquibium carbonis]